MLVEIAGRVEIGVAVHHAVAQKFRVLKSRDHTENSSLLGKGQMRLKSHEVVHSSLFVLLAELNDRVRLLAYALVDKSDGLERSEEKRVLAASCHYLDRHTALEHLDVLLLLVAVKLLEFCFFSGHKCLPESVVLLLIHRAVDVIRIALVVARGKESDVGVDALSRHDRCCCVKEVKRAKAELVGDVIRHRLRCERSGRDNAYSLSVYLFSLGVDHLDVRVVLYFFCDIFREFLSVDRKRRACGNARCICRLHYQRAHTAHLLFEKTDRVRGHIRTQRVGADKLRKAVCVVRGSVLVRLHLDKRDQSSALCRLPRRLTACKSRTVNGYSFICHTVNYSSLSLCSIALL